MSDKVEYLSTMYTTFELLEAAARKVRGFRNTSMHSEAGRNYAIALTLIEDTQMRTTRGHAIAQGKFAPADLERDEQSG
jgi:hypothetical protein